MTRKSQAAAPADENTSAAGEADAVETTAAAEGSAEPQAEELPDPRTPEEVAEADAQAFENGAADLGAHLQAANEELEDLRAQISGLASVISEEFGGPTEEDHCPSGAAIRIMREQKEKLAAFAPFDADGDGRPGGSPGATGETSPAQGEPDVDRSKPVTLAEAPPVERSAAEVLGNALFNRVCSESGRVSIERAAVEFKVDESAIRTAAEQSDLLRIDGPDVVPAR